MVSAPHPIIDDRPSLHTSDADDLGVCLRSVVAKNGKCRKTALESRCLHNVGRI